MKFLLLLPLLSALAMPTYADSIIGFGSSSGRCSHQSSYRVKVSCNFQSKAVEFDYVGSPFAHSGDRFRCERNLDFYFPDLPEGQVRLESNEGFMPSDFRSARLKINGNQHDFNSLPVWFRSRSSTDGMIYTSDINEYSFDLGVLTSDNQRENLGLLLPEGTGRMLCTYTGGGGPHCDLRGSDSFILSFPRLIVIDGKNTPRSLLIKDTMQATLTQNSYVMNDSVVQETVECSIHSANVNSYGR